MADTGQMLLKLALSSATKLNPEEAFWRKFGCRYLTAARLASRAPRNEGTLPKGEPEEPPAEQLENLLANGPWTGVNKPAVTDLISSWRSLDRAFSNAVKHSNCSVNRYFDEYVPQWSAVGAVCLNIAEAPRTAPEPFVLLWTYVKEISERGELQYRPLREALTEFGAPSQHVQLLGLLSSVYEAANRFPWIAKSKGKGGVFRAEALNAAQAYELLMHENQLRALGISIRTPRAWKGLLPVKPSLRVVIGQNSPSFLTAQTLLDLDLEVTIGQERLNEAEVLYLLNGTDELKLLRGRWVTVDRDNVTNIAEQLERMGKLAATGVTLPEATRLLAGLGPTEATRTAWGGIEAGPGLSQLLQDLRHPERLAEVKAPRGLRGTLRTYQKTGVCWLHFMARVGLGACLADDMGVGKTIQVLALILALKEEAASAHRAPHIIVAPASVVSSWEQEIKRFAPTLRYRVVCSSKAFPPNKPEKSAVADFKNLDLVLTTYGLLLEIPILQKIVWHLVILDEAQAIKNPKTQQARAAKTLKARARLILTGTPVENHSTDLWSLFDFLNPGLLGSQREFYSFYEECAARGSLSPLRTLVQPYILRRLKTDPMISTYLPQKNEREPTYCALSHAQVIVYQQQRDALAAELKESTGLRRRGVVLKYIMAFRQICNALEHWHGVQEWTENHSGKLRELRKLAEQYKNSDRKMLVFTAFAEAIQPLATHLERVFGQRGVVLEGSIPMKDRAAIWTEFQEDPNVRFFVLTIGTGGAGLNLSAASVVVHYDRWWNPAKERQATDRAHRFGQKHDVDVYRFISKGTVEERMHELITSKQALFEELFEVDDPVRITEMNDEEILALVSLDLRQVSKDKDN